jgi:hypothetical protein
MKGAIRVLEEFGIGREISGISEAQRGDILQTWTNRSGKITGHSSMVYEVKRNSRGEIVELTTISANLPRGISPAIKPKKFSGRRLRRGYTNPNPQYRRVYIGRFLTSSPVGISESSYWPHLKAAYKSFAR